VVTSVIAPMAGKIIKVTVNVGDTVKEDDEVAILEAMKMEMPIVAPSSGKVKEVKTSAGVSVEADQVIIVLE
jgi:acetyl-CoA carboxylase biotin carboxyl carrier protein